MTKNKLYPSYDYQMNFDNLKATNDEYFWSNLEDDIIKAFDAQKFDEIKTLSKTAQVFAMNDIIEIGFDYEEKDKTCLFLKPIFPKFLRSEKEEKKIKEIATKGFGELKAKYPKAFKWKTY